MGGGNMNCDGQVWNLNSSRNVYGVECDGQVLRVAISDEQLR